jgi:hypothetical protein
LLFSFAFVFFYQNQRFCEAFDCGLRLLANGYRFIIQNLKKFIFTVPFNQKLLHRIWDFLYIIPRLQKYRTAAFLSCQFYEHFQEDFRFRFLVYIFDLFLQHDDNFVLEKIGISLISNSSFPENVRPFVKRLIFQILSIFRNKLDNDQQNILFSKLNDFTTQSEINVAPFPFIIHAFEFSYLRKTENNRFIISKENINLSQQRIKLFWLSPSEEIHYFPIKFQSFLIFKLKIPSFLKLIHLFHWI